ncbi:transposase, partial [Pseudomonas avellanae]
MLRRVVQHIPEKHFRMIRYCGFHAIRTLSPPTSGHPFHAHPDRQSERSNAG